MHTTYERSDVTGLMNSNKWITYNNKQKYVYYMTTIFISENVKYISQHNQMLSLTFQDNTVKKLSLNDIELIIIESLHCSISIPVLSLLASHNIATVFPDNNHHPVAQILPYQANKLLSKFITLQTTISDKLKETLWNSIITNKIQNQIHVLKAFDLQHNHLQRVMNSKQSTQAREALAAKYYFSTLLSSSFKRSDDENNYNSFLNYGYTVLRSIVSRHICGHGLHPFFGLFHSNQYNTFPLSDDLMEPFRPYVDSIVKNFKDEELSPKNKQALILNIYKLSDSIDKFVLSFRNSLLTYSNQLTTISYEIL